MPDFKLGVHYFENWSSSTMLHLWCFFSWAMGRDHSARATVLFEKLLAQSLTSNSVLVLSATGDDVPLKNVPTPCSPQEGASV